MLTTRVAKTIAHVTQRWLDKKSYDSGLLSSVSLSQVGALSYVAQEFLEESSDRVTAPPYERNRSLDGKHPHPAVHMLTQRWLDKKSYGGGLLSSVTLSWARALS
jgi:hypothetical protein